MRKLIALVAFLVVATPVWAQNTLPIADAGPDKTTLLNTTIALDGSKSYSPEGNPILAWSWEMVSQPADSAYPLEFADQSTALFNGTALGEYVIMLTVNDGYFWSTGDLVTITVVANQPPVAVLNATPTTGPAPLTVLFDGSKSYDPDAWQALRFAWDLGDGNISSNATVSHTYTEPGTYSVILFVFDPYNAYDVAATEIVVLPPFNNPPVSSPTCTPNTGNAPLTVHFAANATDADNDPLTYSWTFGDGTTSIDANPVHTYAQPGTYVASLTVSDGKDQASGSLTIAVNPAITMAVQRVEVRMQSGTSTLGGVELTANVIMPTPAATDQISVTFDGIELFSSAFGNFAPSAKDPNVYKLKDRNVLVTLDLTIGQLMVVIQKVNLASMNITNGVDVQFNVGPWTAVQNVTVVAGKGGRLIYTAPTQ